MPSSLRMCALSLASRSQPHVAHSKTDVKGLSKSVATVQRSRNDSSFTCTGAPTSFAPRRQLAHLKNSIAGANPVPPQKLFTEARAKEAEILALFKQVSIELQGDDAWKHHRVISPGIEEYIEAAAFFHYLEHRTIVTLEEIRAKIGACGIHVTEEDYLCGLGDMTGELMRFGINSVGAELSQTRSSVSDAEQMIRQVKKGCEPLVPHTRMLGKKMGEMDRSLRKLEDASYTLALRGAECAAFPEALKELVRQLQDAPARETAWEDNRMDDA